MLAPQAMNKRITHAPSSRDADLQRHPITRMARRGFSLVEVALALGVVSFAMVSMLGVMSVGLTTVKDASDQTMHAQIISRVSSSVLQTPFDDIDNYVGRSPLYFDREGAVVASGADSIYRANLQLATHAGYPGAPTDLGNSARIVQIEVKTVPPGGEQPLSRSSASLVIPRS